MDSNVLVNGYLEAGSQLIEALEKDGFSVSVAAWVTTRDERIKNLYIASPELQRLSALEGYAKVHELMRRGPDANNIVSGIKIIGPEHPVARDIIKIRDRYRVDHPMRYSGTRLGLVPIEEALIYPQRAG